MLTRAEHNQFSMIRVSPRPRSTVAEALDSQTLWQADRLAFSDLAWLAFGFWYGGAASTVRAGGDIGEAKGVSSRGRRGSWRGEGR